MMMPVMPMMAVRHCGRRGRDSYNCGHHDRNNQQLFHFSSPRLFALRPALVASDKQRI
jgi:hypothetical protein